MPESPSIKGRLHELDVHAFLILQDVQLQGVKDRQIAAALKTLSAADIQMLARSGSSGKIRHLAGQLEGRTLVTERTITNIARTLRDECARLSALDVRAKALKEHHDKTRAALITIFIEKAKIELQEQTTDNLREMLGDETSPWPQKLVLQVLSSRPGIPGAAESDHWREQQ